MTVFLLEGMSENHLNYVHTHTHKKTVLDFTSVESSDLDCPVS